ncbi:response regulator [Halomonas litopenaei]|uniref:response regulator n=1 Tax=Halomonas litopenaei TaxID=2109328 RepID=UPI003FA01C4C
MEGDDSRDRFWRRLVIPILWPVVAAQGVLLALCLVLGASLHWLMPAVAGWSTTLWIVMGLLVGTTLNILVFLVLLKHRLSRAQRDFDSLLERVESQLLAQLDGSHDAPSPEDSLMERVSLLLEVMDARSQAGHRRRGSPPDVESNDAVRPASQGEFSADTRADIRADSRAENTPDTLGEPSDWEHESRRLEAALSRAREESRLKSSYLSHVGKALAPLIAELDQLINRAGDGAEPEALRRLSDIRLLLDNLEDGTDTAPVVEPSEASSDEAPPRVLIVDDGPVNLMLAREVLERRGVEVVTATRGEEALERLAAVAVDLVLMDIVLPDIDGVETCRRLRAMEAADSGRPRAVVIALTANASGQDQERFQQAGMDAWLAKPYRPQALLELLDHWLPLSMRSV